VNAKLDRGALSCWACRHVNAVKAPMHRQRMYCFQAIWYLCSWLKSLLSCPPDVRPAVMREAFEAIWELHTEDKIPLRTAAFVKALQVGCASIALHAASLLPCAAPAV